MTQKKIFKICALVMGVSGFIILFASVYPIVSYEWEAQRRYPVLISPLVDKETASFKLDKRDYTKASNWFENNRTEEEKEVKERVSYFTISIPKLDIKSATVKVGGEDLSDSLIQYSGTALPGKVGNSVIFGHSVLPQYFNPDNYLTIFSTLPEVDKGDVVHVNYDGIQYNYVVEEMFEVRPTDIQILEQSKQGSHLTLVTCTPPGHPLKPKRLIVRARLLPNDASGNVSSNTEVVVR